MRKEEVFGFSSVGKSMAGRTWEERWSGSIRSSARGKI